MNTRASWLLRAAALPALFLGAAGAHAAASPFSPPAEGEQGYRLLGEGAPAAVVEEAVSRLEAPPSYGARRRALRRSLIVPGWGQWTRGDRMTGLACAAAVVGLVATGLARAMPGGGPRNDNVALLFFGGAAALYGLNVADAWYRTPPDPAPLAFSWRF